MMDLQKEREAFETWLFSTEKFKFRNKNFLFMLDEYGSYEDKPVLGHWETWQAAKAQSEKALLEQFEINNKLVEQIERLKAQAIPDGFVVVPKEPTEKMIDAGHDFCKNNIVTPSGFYKAMIKAREQAND